MYGTEIPIFFWLTKEGYHIKTCKCKRKIEKHGKTHRNIEQNEEKNEKEIVEFAHLH